MLRPLGGDKRPPAERAGEARITPRGVNDARKCLHDVPGMSISIHDANFPTLG